MSRGVMFAEVTVAICLLKANHDLANVAHASVNEDGDPPAFSGTQLLCYRGLKSRVF